jgi:DNA-binding transcriptional LysR family regulator
VAELTLSGLRVLVAVADHGSFSSAADALGYTQSAVSRQVASLESAVGQRVFERGRSGVRLTAAGARLLPRAVRLLADLDAALADAAVTPAGRVRVGAFPVAAATLVPHALAAVATEHPALVVSLREAGSASLARAVRAGTLDLVVVAQAPPYRPLDAESPALEVVALAEAELGVAVGGRHRLARRRAVEVEELEGLTWVGSPVGGSEPVLGVWPGLRERADVRYVARDWLTKLRLVATGVAVTTVPPLLAPYLPAGVRILAVRGEPVEARRLSVLRRPGPVPPEQAVVLDALRGALRSR